MCWPWRKAQSTAQSAEGATVQDVLDRIDAKLEAIRGSVTRYAEPPWGAGWNGKIEAAPILMDWVCKPDACAACKKLAAGSPYAHLPAWPQMGDTPCGKECRCEIRANQKSWDNSLRGMP